MGGAAIAPIEEDVTAVFHKDIAVMQIPMIDTVRDAVAR